MQVAEDTIEPPIVALTDIEATMLDQLVERRQMRTGEAARVARREVVRQVVSEGLVAVAGRDGGA